MKLILGISGASGINLALKFIEHLPIEHQLFVVLSKHSKKVAHAENALQLKGALKQSSRPLEIFEDYQIDAPIASGSFRADAMAIIPASLNIVAKIAHGLCEDLMSRAAAVMLKEQKKLLIAPRELPLHALALQNLLSLAQVGAIIAPPMLTYYTKPQDLESMELFLVGKWFDALGIDNQLYTRWGQPC
ncbi:UbiX family flavin prenyltransferase [Helicobacter cynogastricus]|uniref:UbiX family flavin prenyltransferase n=1 Tax=Helicobacter cynogastricus TaxID=329937 RepID=UPI000CF0E412|nr:UbiX family flavin prenyltransferase [Helicobacter cynogastricus]